MLTRRSFDRTLFAIAILLGAIVCFWVPEKIQEFSCGSETTNADNEKPDRAVKPSENNNPNVQQPKPDQINDPPRQSVLCTELRLTDLGLVFFTYCLVIVGWFSLRASERNLEVLERAYVFHGYSPLEFRENQTRFNLIMINAGKMPALVKEVGYKFLPRTNLPVTPKQIDWIWETLEYDFIVRPGQNSTIGRFLSLEGDQTFVTYIKYQDMFTKRTHFSWMGMHIYPNRADGEQSARAGGDAWNDWD